MELGEGEFMAIVVATNCGDGDHNDVPFCDSAFIGLRMMWA